MYKCDLSLETWFSSLAVGFMVSIYHKPRGPFEKSMPNIKLMILTLIYFMSKKKKSGWPNSPMVSGQAMDSMDPGSTRKLRVKFTTNFTW